MTIPASHLDAVVAYLIERGEQRGLDICAEMSLRDPFVQVTPYLLKILRKEGRIERVGVDSYRAVPAKMEGSE
jgi:hypothetical protein